MFECITCGGRFEPKGFESTGTFYTLCEKCSEDVLREWGKKQKSKVVP